MLAFVCHFYGWTDDHVLQMPARRFFAFHAEAQRMEARQYSELADLHLIANNMKLDYYIDLKEKYNAMIYPNYKAKQLPPKPGGPVLEAGSEDATTAMRSVGLNMKKWFGYGGR